MEKITEKWTCVNKNWQIKIIISLTCFIGYFFHVGFYDGCPLVNHFLYSFCHANLFHLFINLMVFWGIRNRIQIVEALTVAIAVSFLPMYTSGPTMGLSGFVFAAFGIMWGKTGRWLDAIKKAMPFILATMIVSNVNGLLHLYTFVVGYSIGFFHKIFHKF